MQLKDFQQETLDALAKFAADAAALGPHKAFHADKARGLYQRPLEKNGVPILTEDPPYVCVRVPTGGGKTILGACAIGTILRHGLERDRAVVLWLVPSTAIADQTLKALRDPRHPYRRALAEGLASEAIQVQDGAEALSLSRAAALGETVIIVATLQSFRQDKTEGRKVYDDNGSLYAFREDLCTFAATNPNVLELIDGTPEPRCSLRNVLAMHNPIVLLDEAHNARTSLSFETLARLRPSWLLELTATPDRRTNPSNVLHKVYAAQVKLSGMIKLPIEIENAEDAETALQKAKSRRDRLETIAGGVSDRYLRPICLIQAEPDAHGNEWTVKKVLAYLTEMLGIPAGQVIEHTGAIKGTRGLDLFSSKEPAVRYIVTQKALAEGWDCSFAYVLCALPSSHSAKDVEQLLGRVMRMPQAQGFDHGDLNRAYAVIRSLSFQRTIQELKDRFVVECGFEGVPLAEIIAEQPQLPELLEPATGRIGGAVTLPALNMDSLPAEIRSTVIVSPSGALSITRANLARHFPAIRNAAQDAKAIHAVAQLNLSLSERGQTLRVPELLYRGHPFRENDFAARPLQLAGLDADFAFNTLAAREIATIDANFQKLDLVYEFGVSDVIMPVDAEGTNTAIQLAWSLDQIAHRGGKHTDVPQPHGRQYCQRVVQSLRNKGNSLAQIELARFRLAGAISAVWDHHRETLRKQAYNAKLFDDDSFSAQPTVCFEFQMEDKYLPKRECTEKFNRHLYRHVGELNNEELPVARILNGSPHVATWVRNLDPALGGNPRVSWWLQLANGRFYPDMVAMLVDGRCVVIEYKGEHLDDGLDADEKRAIGKKWAAETGGLFEWITKPAIASLATHWAKAFASQPQTPGGALRGPQDD